MMNTDVFFFFLYTVGFQAILYSIYCVIYYILFFLQYACISVQYILLYFVIKYIGFQALFHTVQYPSNTVIYYLRKQYFSICCVGFHNLLSDIVDYIVLYNTLCNVPYSAGCQAVCVFCTTYVLFFKTREHAQLHCRVLLSVLCDLLYQIIY